MPRVLAFLFAGFFFEVIFLVFTLEIGSLPISQILGTGLSMASLPLLTAFFLSAGLASSFPLGLLNLAALAFAAGIFGSVLAFLLWQWIKNTKMAVQLRFGFQRP